MEVFAQDFGKTVICMASVRISLALNFQILGVYEYPNGDRWEGERRDGKAHGKSTIYY